MLAGVQLEKSINRAPVVKVKVKEEVAVIEVVAGEIVSQLK